MVAEDEYLKRIHSYSVKGFSDPSGRRGLAVFVNPKLKFRYLSEFSVRTDEYHMVTLQHKRLIVVQVYCPHGMNNSGLKEVIDKIENLADIYDDVVVCGDFNARMGIVESEGFNANGKLLKRWLKESKFFRVRLNEVTYTPKRSCLDHILTTRPEAVVKANVCPDELNSDHKLIYVELKLNADFGKNLHASAQLLYGLNLNTIKSR